MDALSHALAGAAVGHHYGSAATGAFFGVLPDLVLGVKRLAAPTTLYNATHSALFSCVLGVCAWLVLGSPLVLLALLSHLLLDLPTHGRAWAPPLLYPFSSRRFGLGVEWEFFNTAWILGANITLLWCALWLVL